MAATQLSFTLRTSTNVKTTHLVGSWDNYIGQLPLSKDPSKSGGWKGTFRFSHTTLKTGQRYWYYVRLPSPPKNSLKVPNATIHQSLVLTNNASTSWTVITCRTTPPNHPPENPRPVARSISSTFPDHLPPLRRRRCQSAVRTGNPWKSPRVARYLLARLPTQNHRSRMHRATSVKPITAPHPSWRIWLRSWSRRACTVPVTSAQLPRLDPISPVEALAEAPSPPLAIRPVSALPVDAIAGG